MIINLRKSVLFTVDPDARFSREHDVPRGTWTLLFQRYRYLEYTPTDLCELYNAKTGKHLSPKNASRWIWRGEIYSLARNALDRGAVTVVSSYFGEHEYYVVKEITKNLKSSVRQNAKILA